jgi:hypothetical protein
MENSASTKTSTLAELKECREESLEKLSEECNYYLNQTQVWVINRLGVGNKIGQEQSESEHPNNEHSWSEETDDQALNHVDENK